MTGGNLPGDGSPDERADDKAGESDGRYRSLVDSSPDGVLVSRGKRIIFANPALAALLGHPTGSALIGTDTIDIVDPAHRQDALEVMACLDRTGETQRVEIDLIRLDGTSLRVDAIATPIVFDELRGSHLVFRDISHRARRAEALRQSEASLRESQLRRFAQALINAQEQERRRIARELHDDLSQQLVLLAQRVAALVGSGSEPSKTHELHEVNELVASLAARAHDLAYELHPTTVEHLGLVPALASLASQFGPRNEFEVEFRHSRVPATNDQISLCLYRIAQEALQNVVRHAGTRHASVELSGSNASVALKITDRGCGFDPDRELLPTGLGLTSMTERARIVGGDTVIHSRPGWGTVIEVTLPLDAVSTVG